MTQTKLLFLIEDETIIQLAVEVALKDGGYDVLVAQDGAEAMAELEKDATRFRGIITDIRLGSGPDGWAVAHRARELVPGIPIIYMSGDSASDWSANGVPNSIIVSKPFAVAQIVTAISTLLIDRGS